jgi:hypothetical protein
MSRLVNGDVEAVEEAVPLRMEQEQEPVERQDRGEDQTRAVIQQRDAPVSEVDDVCCNNRSGDVAL